MNSSLQSDLARLRRQYFQLVDPTALRWPDALVLKTSSVQLWLFENLFDTTNITSAPPERYRLRVLKPLISKLEKAIDDPEEDEISDDLMGALSELLSSTLPSESASVQQKASVTYTFVSDSGTNSTSNDKSVTLLESRSVISSSGTTGLRTWEAALLLGSFLVSEQGRSIILGKNILELGAGTGMISILCAKHLGASGVVATDGDEAVVDAITVNTFLNGLDTGESSVPVRTAALRWGWPVDAPSFAEDYGMGIPDVVLGADVTYDRSVIPSLVASLREFFELNAGLQVLIAATIRNEQTFDTFQNTCRRNGFCLELVEFPPVPEEHQDGPFYPTSTPIQIWRITQLEKSKDAFAF